MKTYTISDYLNADYETQNKIFSFTKLKLLVLDILSLVFSFSGFFFLELEVENIEK